jgi:hypothetical protein
LNCAAKVSSEFSAQTSERESKLNLQIATVASLTTVILMDSNRLGLLKSWEINMNMKKGFVVWPAPIYSSRGRKHPPILKAFPAFELDKFQLISWSICTLIVTSSPFERYEATSRSLNASGVTYFICIL